MIQDLDLLMPDQDDSNAPRRAPAPIHMPFSLDEKGAQLWIVPNVLDNSCSHAAGV